MTNDRTCAMSKKKKFEDEDQGYKFILKSGMLTYSLNNESYCIIIFRIFWAKWVESPITAYFKVTRVAYRAFLGRFSHATTLHPT